MSVSWQLPAALGVPWFVGTLPQSMPPSSRYLSSRIRILVTGFRAHPSPGRSHLELLNYIAKHPFPK